MDCYGRNLKEKRENILKINNNNTNSKHKCREKE